MLEEPQAIEQPTTGATESTPQPAAAPETAPEPVLTGPELMESIIAEHDKQNEPAQEPQRQTKPDEQQPAEAAPAYDPQLQGEVDVWLRELDETTAFELAAGVLNNFPNVIEHNRNYVLGVLGLPTNEHEAQRQLAEIQHAEYEHARTLATETRAVFDEYVAKGKSLGLNELEAAGLAALAYAEIEGQYWKDGTESRKVFDAWHGHIKSGDKLRSGDGRRAYVRAFEKVYARTAGKYPDPRGRARSKSSGAELMKETMREFGVSDEEPVERPTGDPSRWSGEETMRELMWQRRHGNK